MDVADPIPPSVKALAELFNNELADVAFPGVDGAILQQLMTDVESRTEAVTKAEAALEAARTALRESEEVLTVKAQKALAYARVFAEDRPEVAEKVNLVARIAGTSTSSLSTRESGSDTPPKRRGRPRARAASAAPADTDVTPAAPSVVEVTNATEEVTTTTEEVAKTNAAPEKTNGVAHPD